MFIRTLKELEGLGRIKVLQNGTTRSARFLTAADGMGFSYNENRVGGGSTANLWYKNHWEANYIIAGKGKLVDLHANKTYPLEAGVLYTVGPNDRHHFITDTDEHHISVFCPALRGDEKHDADGGYEGHVPGPKTDRRLFVKRADEMRAQGKEMVAANGAARTIRMLTKADDVGFGFSDVNFKAGAETTLWYKHHWEANHIVSGTLEVTELSTGKVWMLGPSDAYNVGPKDRHKLRAVTDVHLVSVFCPPLVGNEQHDKDGALSASGPIPPGPPGY